MPFRVGDRIQNTFLPQSIEDYVPFDSPVRAYDAFIEALNLSELGFDLDSYKVGNPQYHPGSMLKLIVYSYSYGFQSSRKIERECHYNLSYMWLMGGLKPDHKTIAEFRRKNEDALKEVIKMCARLCVKLNLIDGNILFVDGTKMQADASHKQTHDKKYYEKKLEKIDQRINDIIAGSEKIDAQEQHQGSFVSMDEELAKAETLKAKVENALDEFNKNPDLKKVNLTDTDCRNMKDKNIGVHPSYNIQSTTDDKNGLIVNVEVEQTANDLNQFSKQIDLANETLGKQCEAACGDAGYSSVNDLAETDSKNIKVIVPSNAQAQASMNRSSNKEKERFNKKKFTYDKEKDCYSCPEGHTLRSDGKDQKASKKSYIIRDATTCFKCKNYGECTSAKRGRKVTRLYKEELKEKLEAQYEEPESKKIFSRRKHRAETPFGHTKHNLKSRRFNIRGKKGAQAESSILGTCFNIVRMINILGGVAAFVERIREISSPLYA